MTEQLKCQTLHNFLCRYFVQNFYSTLCVITVYLNGINFYFILSFEQKTLYLQFLHFLEEYKYSDYIWDFPAQCELYFPERQIQNHLTVQPPSPLSNCGNGFKVFEQTECVVGDFSLPVQNQAFCPPKGFNVQSCFNWCSGKQYIFF